MTVPPISLLLQPPLYVFSPWTVLRLITHYIEKRLSKVWTLINLNHIQNEMVWKKTLFTKKFATLFLRLNHIILSKIMCFLKWCVTQFFSGHQMPTGFPAKVSRATTKASGFDDPVVNWVRQTNKQTKQWQHMVKEPSFSPFTLFWYSLIILFCLKGFREIKFEDYSSFVFFLEFKDILLFINKIQRG